MLVENVVYFMVTKDEEKKKVTSLIKKQNIIAKTMIHFDVVFNAPWVIGLWIVHNINIDFNPICFSFEVISWVVYHKSSNISFEKDDTFYWKPYILSDDSCFGWLCFWGRDEMLTMMILITFPLHYKITKKHH